MRCCTLILHVQSHDKHATGFTSTTGRQYILVLNESLYIKEMDNTLVNPNQLRHFDAEVQDNPYHSTDPMSITSPNSEFMAYLQSQGTMYFSIHGAQQRLNSDPCHILYLRRLASGIHTILSFLQQNIMYRRRLSHAMCHKQM